MSLKPGQRVAHYEIEGPLGAGGMGEVYRARDTKLERSVAIKVLPREFVEDRGRLDRFLREAKLLASVNHPKIATVHGLEEQGGHQFLIMELVAGEDLSERIARGPLPVEEALTTALHIAEAVEAAHEQGVIHRDLKPANIRVLPDEEVKVLDFGLAKATELDPASSDPSQTPTFAPTSLSMQGVILGTAAYMSPEQARGRAVDKRADIWAFGCVLYEMLTGRQAFEGETITDTLAAILRAEPDWSLLPAGTPSSIRSLLLRCFKKNPRQRLRDIGDARIEIQNELSGEKASEVALEAAAGEQPIWQKTLPWVVVALLVVAVVVLALQQGGGSSDDAKVSHLAAILPEDLELDLSPETNIALSPDGKSLVFAANSERTTQLYLRQLDGLEVIPITGTEGASNPFFSPDGNSVGYFSGGKLRRISLQGGVQQTLADAPNNRGGAWASDDQIIYSPEYTSGLMSIPAEGGVPEVLTAPDTANGERTHRWPFVLPGGKAVLFTIGQAGTPGYYEDSPIGVFSRETGKRKTVFEGASFAAYSTSGHLILARARNLHAVAFDLGKLEVVGGSVPVLEQVGGDETSGAIYMSLSNQGSLAYVRASPLSIDAKLVIADRNGNLQRLTAPAKPYRFPRVSPDGKQIVMDMGPGAGRGDIWTYSFNRGTLTRITVDDRAGLPIWTPDGAGIVFVIYGGGIGRRGGINRIASDGSGEMTRLHTREGGGPELTQAADFTPDQRILILNETGNPNVDGIYAIHLDEDSRKEPLIQTPFMDVHPDLSPDGKWLAYASIPTGQPEVFIQGVFGAQGKWQVSSNGGLSPVWNRNGRELFYAKEDTIFSVAIRKNGTLQLQAPRMLFATGLIAREETRTDYDVFPDGNRFIFVDRGEKSDLTSEVIVILNWSLELARLNLATGN